MFFDFHLRIAAIDFMTVLEHDPGCAPAEEGMEYVEACLSRGEETSSDQDYDTSEYDWPHFDDSAQSSAAESDSSDCSHKGNGISCRFYNHGGCNRGTNCKFSHAPDEKSLRDEL